jgi:predicted nucleic acid-binding OB-fold protein
MNNELQKYARTQLAEGLAQLPEDNQRFFVRIFNNENREAGIEETLKLLTGHELDKAMDLVQRTLTKKSQKMG